jgi:uncharacterized protein
LATQAAVISAWVGPICFKVSAVVHGHTHHGRYEGRTPAGAPVYNVAGPIPKPTGRPYALIKV